MRLHEKVQAKRQPCRDEEEESNIQHSLCAVVHRDQLGQLMQTGTL